MRKCIYCLISTAKLLIASWYAALRFWADTQACPDGHYQRIWYNSCKHRMCPQCAYLQIQQWLAKRKTRILRCDHFHVIEGMRAQQVQNLMNKLGRKKWNVRI